MQIKDSGERRTFSTGAQRDRAVGKGRMDLIPWNAVFEVADNAQRDLNFESGMSVSALTGIGVEHAARYVSGWSEANHLAMAAWFALCALETRCLISVDEYVEDDAESRCGIDRVDNEGLIEARDFLDEAWEEGYFDLLPWNAIIEVSKIFEAGAVKYAARNWEKGMPIDEFLDSGLRHAAKYMAGWKDENHLAMFAWNLLCALETCYQIAIGELPKELGIMARQKIEPQANDGRIERNPEYWEAA